MSNGECFSRESLQASIHIGYLFRIEGVRYRDKEVSVEEDATEK